MIREHSEQEIRDIYAVRIALEGYASRLATENATDNDMRMMSAAHAAIDAFGPVEDPEGRGRLVRLHDEFHDSIFRSAASPVLRDAILSYRKHPYNRRVAHTYNADESKRAAESHALMMDAIRRRASDTAEQLTREHLVLSREVTVSRLLWGL